MYDIEFVIPATARAEPFKTRLLGLKTHGILNVKSHKVLLTILLGKESPPDDLKSGWPANVDLQIVNSTNDYNACKVYDYFSNHEIETRWCAKIDDDTANDVDFLLKKLDAYGHNEKLYFAAKLDNYVEKTDTQLLTDLGYRDWFCADKAPWHEIEGSIVSQAGLKAILKTNNSMELMKRRAKLPFGFTDVCLAMAAQIAGIYPIEATFMSHLPYICGFSMFGGPFGHIHQIALDRDAQALQFFTTRYHNFINGGENKEPLYKQLLNKEYNFYIANSTFPIGTIRFDPLYAVGNYKNFNEANWYVKDNRLYFVNYCGRVNSDFIVTDNMNTIYGFDKNRTKLILRKFG